MKKTILNIIFLIMSVLSYGQGIYYASGQITRTSSINISNNSYNYNNRYANNPVTYSTPSIGYSTNINGLNKGMARYNNYSSYKQTNSFYTGTYTPSTTPIGKSGPRKSKERPYSGNFLEDLEDWWRIQTDSNWPDYVDDDYWDEFLSAYPGYEDEVRNWYESQGQKFPGDPEDPFLTPVGEFPIGLLLILLFGYLFYKINNKRTKKL